MNYSALSAGAGAHIEYSSRSCAEDITITNVIIKTPDRKYDWGVNGVMPGGENSVISKKTLVEIWLWVRSVQPEATGCAARLLGQAVEILILGRAVQLGVCYERCRNSRHNKKCVCVSLSLSLSSCRKTKLKKLRGYPRGVMVKAMDYGIVVREFVLQSRYYVQFRANTLGKGMNPLILPAMG